MPLLGLDVPVYQQTVRSHELGANKLVAVSADTLNLPPNKGFIASVTGIANVRARMDGLAGGASVNVPVTAGVPYPIDIIDFSKTNSTAAQTLVLLQQGG